MSTINKSQRAFVIVTGASRGIGRSVAVQLAEFFAANSVLVLVARDAQALEETADHIRQSCGNRITLRLLAIDLAEPTDNELQQICRIDGAATPSPFDVALIVHNVGTIGDITLGAAACGNAVMWQSYYATNVFSVARLNVCFLERFAVADGKTSATTAVFVVNVTTKCSTVPYASFTMYCTSRAAREMYFRVLAVERPDVRVLNYGPGVVDTAMTVDVQARSADGKLRDMFRSMRDGSQMLRPVQTAEQLVLVLESGDFESGAFVDYYESVERMSKSVVE